MGGDHKCSVCQATFTRPQHVARHMRSHTGDRPYKCQHCGDQFARSDLLSRHINKCHANEKPPPNTGNTRRKGSASASRATTSKQACDQCVQSSLPCDGCNPCAKCVQRKCRCTFVKFHRQTAPAGPGHNPRPVTASSRLPLYSQSADDFLLGPAPSGVPTMADNLYPQSFSFPQLYPSTTDSAPSLSLPEGGLADYTAKFRASAESLRRTGNPMSGPPAGPGVPGGGVAPGLYNDPRSTSSWMGWSQDPSEHFSGVQDSLNVNNGARYLPPIDDSKQLPIDKDVHAALSRHFLTTQPGFSTAGAGDTYPGGYINGRDHDRRGSLDFSSDGSTASHSIPSSTASSSVHLPLEMQHQQHPQQMSYHVSMEEMRQDIQSLTGQQEMGGPQNTYMQHPPQNNRSPPHHHQHRSHGEGAFSSAFGLMSLDDPNILAGLSDGAPFFSNAAMNMLPQDPNATPMPPKHHPHNNNNPNLNPSNSPGVHRSTTLPTPGSTREAETRELREFWKQYMRTPLSGPGPSALDANNGSNNHRNPTSPSNHRRARVASLPSAKTPTADSDKPHFMHNGNGNGGGNNNNGTTSSMRTTLHGSGDDLRSYEAAVMARKAPTTLNLAPRRTRGGAGTNSAGASPQVPSALPGASMNLSGPGGPSAIPSSMNFVPGSRPSSSSSRSSLANAFGKQPPGPGAHVTFAPRSQMDTGGSPPSRESSLSIDDGGSDKDALRPSFKRLPSQTLGPAKTKRALLSIGDGEDGDEDDDEDDDDLVGVGVDRNMPVSGGAGDPGNISKTLNGLGHANHGHGAHQQHPDRPMVNLAERRRRMSAPSTSPTAPTFAAAAAVPGVHQ